MKKAEPRSGYACEGQRFQCADPALRDGACRDVPGGKSCRMARFHGAETAGNPLRILAIKELTETLRLDLVTHREADQPLYIRQLEVMIRDVFASDKG